MSSRPSIRPSSIPAGITIGEYFDLCSAEYIKQHKKQLELEYEREVAAKTRKGKLVDLHLKYDYKSGLEFARDVADVYGLQVVKSSVRHRTKFTPEYVAEVKTLKKAGKTNVEIAEMTDSSPVTVSKALKS